MGMIPSLPMKLRPVTKVIIGLIAVLWAVAAYLAYESFRAQSHNSPGQHNHR